VQLPADAASVTMKTLPALALAEGRLATVDSGGLHCPFARLLYPVHTFTPAKVGKLLVSVVPFFHVFAALQNQRSWLVVSMYTHGGVQEPPGAPALAVIGVAPEPLICVQVPGAPVVVQKERF
jgi:hypothetical protein